jgi:hypothetical protein
MLTYKLSEVCIDALIDLIVGLCLMRDDKSFSLLKPLDERVCSHSAGAGRCTAQYLRDRPSNENTP